MNINTAIGINNNNNNSNQVSTGVNESPYILSVRSNTGALRSGVEVTAGDYM